MAFDGKDKLVQEIDQNNMIMQQLDAAMGMISDLAAVNPMVAEMAMSQGLLGPEQMQQLNNQMSGPPAGASDLKEGSTGSYADKIRARSANAAAPQ